MPIPIVLTVTVVKHSETKHIQIDRSRQGNNYHRPIKMYGPGQQWQELS